MNKLLYVTALLLGSAAMAQSPAPAAAPRDDMEPGVNTSAQSPQSAAPAAPAATAPGSTATVPASASRARPAATSAAGANKPAATPTPGAPGGAAPKGKGNAKDRLDLDASQITGNRELPKVLYIVPWRSAELGDLVGRPVNSLLDEVLEPIDRDVFRRQNRYFEALQPNEAAPAGKPEK
jgi:hypothetical protein